MGKLYIVHVDKGDMPYKYIHRITCQDQEGKIREGCDTKVDDQIKIKPQKKQNFNCHMQQYIPLDRKAGDTKMTHKMH